MSKARPVPSQIVKTPEHVRPQVATLIHREVFKKLDVQSKLFLLSNLASRAFQEFCKFNLEAVKEDLIALSPRPEWTQEEFAQLSNEMRLVWRFWTDLLQYAKDISEEENRDNNEGNVK